MGCGTWWPGCATAREFMVAPRAQLASMRRAGGRGGGKRIQRGHRIEPGRGARAICLSLKRARGGRGVLTSGGRVERRAGAWWGWGRPPARCGTLPREVRQVSGAVVRAARLAEAQPRKNEKRSRSELAALTPQGASTVLYLMEVRNVTSQGLLEPHAPKKRVRLS